MVTPCTAPGCRWPDTPHTCGQAMTPCESCGAPVNAEIRADAPECPHGWLSLDLELGQPTSYTGL